MVGMSSLGMAKLKTLLQDQVLKRDEAGLSASSGAVIDAVRKENPEAIEAASVELQNSAMTRVLSRAFRSAAEG